MRTPIGKFDHFILDRGAVPRACAFDSAGVKRRPVEVGPNDLVRAGSRLSDPARHLFHVELPIAVVIQRKEIIWTACGIRVKTEPRGRFISELSLASGEVD